MIKFCNLYSGSSGNSLLISDGCTRILVDAGINGVSIERSLQSIDEYPEQIDAILVSHDHSDHIAGVGVFSRRYDIPVYANPGTWSQMSIVTGSIKERNVKLFSTGKDFVIGDIQVSSFSIPHDASEPVAFSFFAGNIKLSTATDIGHITEELVANLSGSDLLFLESNHDVNMLLAGRYPYFLKRRILGEQGHLSNETASQTVCRLAATGMTRFILGHLSKENNYPALAYETTNSALLECGIISGRDVLLDIAPRDRAGKAVYI
jgi:phosphoribosyl 1,2-cyclic phosphodiesterase